MGLTAVRFEGNGDTPNDVRDWFSKARARLGLGLDPGAVTEEVYELREDGTYRGRLKAMLPVLDASSREAWELGYSLMPDGTWIGAEVSEILVHDPDPLPQYTTRVRVPTLADDLGLDEKAVA